MIVVLYILYRIVFGQKKVNKKFAHTHRIQNHFFVYKDQNHFFGAFPEIFLLQYFYPEDKVKNSLQENKKMLFFLFVGVLCLSKKPIVLFYVQCYSQFCGTYIAYSVHKGNSNVFIC
jgi:hypothetical protein